MKRIRPFFLLAHPDTPRSLTQTKLHMGTLEALREPCKLLKNMEEKNVRRLLGLLARGDPWAEMLDVEQARTLLVVMLGENVVINGPAGTGKSLLVEKMVMLKSRGAELTYEEGESDPWRVTFPEDADSLPAQQQRLQSIAVTAPTGAAAIALGGVTLHKFFGMRPGGEFQGVRLFDSTKKALSNARLIIVDEISMVAPHFMDHLHQRACTAANRTHPQHEPLMARTRYHRQVVALGDWSQNAPVVRKEEREEKQAAFPLMKLRWLFQHPRYHEWFPVQVQLTRVYRQTTDPEFLGILNRLRTAESTAEDLEVINEQVQKGGEVNVPEEMRKGEIDPVRLFHMNKEVDAYNQGKLQALATQSVTLLASIAWAPHSPDELAWMERNPKRKMKKPSKPDGRVINGQMKALETTYPKVLKLKLGCQVRCTVNLDMGSYKLANGSMGKVVGWCEVPLWRVLGGGAALPEELTLDNDDDVVPRSNDITQCPHAEILPTMPKSQPVVGKKRSADSSWDRKFLIPVIEWEQYGAGLVTDVMLPRILHRPISSTARQGYIAVVGWPLQLSWAMTIHRVQGATFSAAVVQLPAGRLFDPALAYVAISRLRTRSGLTLTTPLRMEHVCADPDVLAYYEFLKERGESSVFVAEQGHKKGGKIKAIAQLPGMDGVVSDSESEEEGGGGGGGALLVSRQGRFDGDRTEKEGVHMKWKEEGARWTQSSSQ